MSMSFELGHSGLIQCSSRRQLLSWSLLHAFCPCKCMFLQHGSYTQESLLRTVGHARWMVSIRRLFISRARAK